MAAPKTEVELSKCPVRSVVVYPDRAEVTRQVEVSLEAGEHEIQLKSISKALHKLVKGSLIHNHIFSMQCVHCTATQFNGRRLVL